MFDTIEEIIQLSRDNGYSFSVERGKNVITLRYTPPYTTVDTS